jgi:hypothetical protein
MLNLFEHLIGVCPQTAVFIKGVIPAKAGIRSFQRLLNAGSSLA